VWIVPNKIKLAARKVKNAGWVKEENVAL